MQVDGGEAARWAEQLRASPGTTVRNVFLTAPRNSTVADETRVLRACLNIARAFHTSPTNVTLQRFQAVDEVRAFTQQISYRALKPTC